VDAAIGMMTAVVRQLLRDSIGEAYYDRALRCVIALRSGAPGGAAGGGARWGRNRCSRPTQATTLRDQVTPTTNKVPFL